MTKLPSVSRLASYVQHASLVCLASLVLLGCSKQPPPTRDTRPLVRVGFATNGVEFAEALNVQGMLRAKNTATIAARVPGTIDEMLVDEGASVSKGAPLFKIDQVNLANAVRAAKDDLAMAKAKLAQAEATDAKAKLDIARMARLVKEGAVTKDVYEKADVAAKSYAAALDAAKATITKAETGLAVAEKNFADSVAQAPFDGTITKKHKNAGDFCSPGAKVFEIEDTSCYEVCAALNAEHYGRVVVGKTELAVATERQQAYDNKTIGSNSSCRTLAVSSATRSCCRTLVVSYKSPSVNPLTRTFEIRAVIPKTDALAAGMLLDCRVVFARRTAQAVPTSAVAHRGGGDCVFKVVDGKVVRVPVVAGLSNHGLREIAASRLAPDDKLIVEGMLLVNEGDEVRTVGK